MNALYCFLFLAVGNAASVVLFGSSVLSAVERTYFQGGGAADLLDTHKRHLEG